MRKAALGAQGPALQQVNIPTDVSWNPDVKDAAAETVVVSEQKNVRQQLWGWEVRSGIREYTLAGFGGLNSEGIPQTGSMPLIPVCMCPYRIDETIVSLTFYWDGSLLGAFVVNPDTGATFAVNWFTVGSTEPLVCATQYGADVIFSVFGKGTYRLAPSSTAATGWNMPELLGKDESPTPASYTFADTTNGSLFVYDASKEPTTDGKKDVLNENIIMDPGQDDPRMIELPIGAKYFRITVGSIFRAAGYPLFERNTTDIVSGTSDDTTAGALIHNPHRSHGYRFVRVRKYKDVKGQEFTWRDTPSTDLWVESAIYAPAQILPPYADTSRPRFGGNWIGDSSSYDNYYLDGGTVGDGVAHAFVPSRDEFMALRVLYRKFIHDNLARPYAWASFFFGGCPDIKGVGDSGSAADRGPRFDRQPYKPYISAHGLKRAPLTVFKWDDFSVTADTVEIEIYRTAYSYPDEKKNAEKSPLFEAHLYGYVGSLKKGGTFTDDIPDDAIDFENDTPDQWVGYRKGDFSGAVCDIFDEKHVLGDISTTSRLLAPRIESAIAGPGKTTTEADGVHNRGYAYADVTQSNAPDGRPVYEFYAQYVDENGRLSDTTKLEVSWPFAYTIATIWIVPPRGYVASITTVNIIVSYHDGTSRRYYLMASVPATQSAIDLYYLPQETYTPVGSSTALSTYITDYGGVLPTGDMTTYHGPGEITWSRLNNLNEWRFKDSEVHHQFARITHMTSVLGPLVVSTDQSVTKTDLNGRKEEDSDKLGCLGRWCGTKYQKVDLFLSKDGLCITEGSAQRMIEGQVHSEVLKYLREEIPGQPALANARRASIGLLGRGRREIWLHFPSSADLYPAGTNASAALPERTFIYREFEWTGLTRLHNYEFEISRSPIAGKVILSEQPDGRLMSAHYDSTRNLLVVQDNDTQDPWPGFATLELRMPLATPTVVKRLSRLWWWGVKKAMMILWTGIERMDGIRDSYSGAVSQNARSFVITSTGIGHTQAFLHKIEGPAEEMKARVPLVRWLSEPDAETGEHDWKIEAVRLGYITDGPSNNK